MASGPPLARTRFVSVARESQLTPQKPVKSAFSAPLGTKAPGTWHTKRRYSVCCPEHCQELRCPGRGRTKGRKEGKKGSCRDAARKQHLLMGAELEAGAVLHDGESLREPLVLQHPLYAVIRVARPPHHHILVPSSPLPQLVLASPPIPGVPLYSPSFRAGLPTRSVPTLSWAQVPIPQVPAPNPS